MTKRRIALCGASGRGFDLYAKYISGHEDLAARNELVGIYDSNPGRARYVASQCGNFPVYETFDEMIHDAKPDLVIVATRDDSHVDYAIRCLEYGVDVLCEKPMAINAEQVVKLREAEIRTGRRIKQVFNLRYGASMIYLKQLVDSGVLGDIYNVHFEYMLTGNMHNQDGHGASYYHRWNRYMDISGGMLVTKATHHFDCVNWLIERRPKKVAAFGELRKYGKNGPFRSERCLGCPYADKCEYYWDVTNESMGPMFHDNEKYDNYYRDACVYAEDIDIYDTLSLIVEYEGGITMSYSETTAGMYEGYKLNINGSKGRIEAQLFQDGGLDEDEKDYTFIRYIDNDGKITKYPLPKARPGSHDGADGTMLDVLLLGAEPEIPSQVADSTDGAYSVLIGAAGNVSIKEGRIVDIDELIGKPELLAR